MELWIKVQVHVPRLRIVTKSRLNQGPHPILCIQLLLQRCSSRLRLGFRQFLSIRLLLFVVYDVAIVRLLVHYGIASILYQPTFFDIKIDIVVIVLAPLRNTVFGFW